MKRIAAIIALFALFCTLSTGAYAGPASDDVKKAKTETEAKAALVASEAAAIDDATWKVFSTNLVHATIQAVVSDYEAAKAGLTAKIGA